MKFSIKGIYKSFQSVRFMQLFVFSLVVMLLQAIFQESPFIILVISFLYLNALLVALSVSSESVKARWLLIVLWTLAVLTRLFVPAGQEMLFMILSKSIVTTLLVIVIVYVLHYVLTSQRVTINALFAAVVVYMLMAIVFAQIYAIMYYLLPSSLSFPAGAADIEGKVAEITFNYFSFITIATLGYGDIVPRHPIAQMLASIEAVIGQFYVAILVAWLVSLFIAHKEETLE